MTPEQYATWVRQQAGPEGVRLTRALVPEPGLPWLSGVTLDAARRSGLVDRLQTFSFGSDEMAPAFPAGCIVAAEPVPGPEQVALNGIYVITVQGMPRYVGRLAEVQVRPYALRLTLDNAVDPHPVILDWRNAEVAVWRVSHYLSFQVQ